MSTLKRLMIQNFVALWDDGDQVELVLRGDEAGVGLPQHLRREDTVVLVYGKNLSIPIPDVEVDEAGVRATLSFGGAPYLTVVSWDSVYAMNMVKNGTRFEVFNLDHPAYRDRSEGRFLN